MPEPASHEYEIEMLVPALPGRDQVEIVFPAWAPGSYMVRDFVRHLTGLTVRDGAGHALPAAGVVRVDKQRWRITSGGRPFRVRYRIFAFDATVRTSFLDDSHAYWNKQYARARAISLTVHARPRARSPPPRPRAASPSPVRPA